MLVTKCTGNEDQNCVIIYNKKDVCVRNVRPKYIHHIL